VHNNAQTQNTHLRPGSAITLTNNDYLKAIGFDSQITPLTLTPRRTAGSARPFCAACTNLHKPEMPHPSIPRTTHRTNSYLQKIGFVSQNPVAMGPVHP
jgi:hypothetical protein